MTDRWTASGRPDSRAGLVARLGVALALLAAMLLMPAGPASAAGSVSVSPAPSASGPTTVTLSGSGFQYQPNAPGGVYVFFGAVSDPAGGSWSPSQGGKSGQSFAYASTGGAQLLIAFEGGDSAEAANGMIRPDGTWSAQMTIPGSTFQATSGNPHAGQSAAGETIDCTVVQCGIITIGAHGMWNANNESFTPISFGGSPTEGFQAPGGSADATTGGGGGPVAVPEQESPDEQAEPEPTAEPSPATDDEPRAAAQVTDDDQGSAVSWIVIGVFAVGLLALVAAIITLVLRSRRQRRQPTPVSAGGAPADTKEQQ